MKTCSRCKTTKELSEFGKRKNTFDGLYYWCKECNKETSKKFNKSNRGQELQTKRNIERYGISVEEYETLLSKQNGVCAICFEPEKHFSRLVIDHCHESDKVRGLLCNNCNRALGMFKDKKALLLSAARYLDE